IPPTHADGFEFTTWIIDTPPYLPCLVNLYQWPGGHIEQRTLTSLNEAPPTHHPPINSTGPPARRLPPHPPTPPAPPPPPPLPHHKHLIHNYGHGGSGITLSWGCAHEVLQLVRTTLEHT